MSIVSRIKAARTPKDPPVWPTPWSGTRKRAPLDIHVRVVRESSTAPFKVGEEYLMQRDVYAAVRACVERVDAGDFE